ncbi:hypothetical protein IVB12_35970 [Bradyrhizobium sp. 179]|uniref:hypothetical protein n=1 Tax=Bradyrhizobium sp. 179 TaxID=2782648 RepID=UPI001FFBD06C|nr:hypothetical protein [Bradyrhizobium sp. 179]MCK1547179.1 hypothetical protein [Bradyrhizobium sp. 179]
MAKKAAKSENSALAKIELKESLGTTIDRIRTANGSPHPDCVSTQLLWHSFIVGGDDAGVCLDDFLERLNTQPERAEVVADIIVDWFYERHEEHYPAFQSVYER